MFHIYIYIYYIDGGFLKRGYPKWMVYREIAIQMDDLGVALFQDTPIYIYIHTHTSYPLFLGKSKSTGAHNGFQALAALAPSSSQGRSTSARDPGDQRHLDDGMDGFGSMGVSYRDQP